jgi:O-acetyl-ADP-ribose deacetylase (regulator of RNase III)
MKEYSGGRIIVLTGDITELKADAIVNAANSSLMGGGGVDGAIHRKGGPKILEECGEIRRTKWKDGLPAGEAVSTTAGNLPARYVIHTVGPVFHGGNNREDEILASADRNSLELAESLNCGSIAFPAISTGVYGFPREHAAAVVSQVLKQYIETGGKISKIYLVFYSTNDQDVFIKNQTNLPSDRGSGPG